MPKYHVNDDGVVSVCTAQKRGCPLGGDEAHGASRAEAMGQYEQRMSGEQVPVSVSKLVPSTAASLAAMKEASATAAEDVEIALNELKRAGNMASARLKELYQRDLKAYTDPAQGAMVHELVNLQTHAMFAILNSQAAVAEDWDGALEAHPAVAHLTDAVEKMKICGRLVSAQLQSLWNEQSRRYDDPPQNAFLHNVINVQAAVTNRVRFALLEFTDPV